MLGGKQASGFVFSPLGLQLCMMLEMPTTFTWRKRERRMAAGNETKSNNNGALGIGIGKFLLAPLEASLGAMRLHCLVERLAAQAKLALWPLVCLANSRLSFRLATSKIIGQKRLAGG